MPKITKKKVKGRELLETKLNFVSYVDKPATGTPFKIIKTKDGGIIGSIAIILSVFLYIFSNYA